MIPLFNYVKSHQRFKIDHPYFRFTVPSKVSGFFRCISNVLKFLLSLSDKKDYYLQKGKRVCVLGNNKNQRTRHKRSGGERRPRRLRLPYESSIRECLLRASITRLCLLLSLFISLSLKDKGPKLQRQWTRWYLRRESYYAREQK